jgi:hypothetical protein
MVERVRRMSRQEKQSAHHRGGHGQGVYDPVNFPRMAEAICRMGATLEQLGQLFGVTKQAVSYWMVKYPEFAAAVNGGLFEVFSPRVVRSLAEQAIGYTVEMEESKVLSNGQIVKYTTKKHYPPNVTACIFWLKNRQPNDWRDVRDCVVEHNSLDKLTSKQLLEEIREEAKRMGILDTPEFSKLKEDTEESKKSIKH